MSLVGTIHRQAITSPLRESQRDSILSVTRTILCALPLLLFAFPWDLLAGGSSLNVVLVVNQVSTNSVELGNYYAERRSVNPENILRINWPGPNTSWTPAEFTNTLLNPLFGLINSRQLSNQVDYVVLSMDIPFQVFDGVTSNSTTAAIYYGLKPDSKGNASPYYAAENTFRQSRPSTLSGYSFLATMITGNTLTEVKALVDHGVDADGTSPGQPVVLTKSSDQSRNFRYKAFDNAILNGGILGKSILIRTNGDPFPGGGPFMGFETGLQDIYVPPDSFVPGSLADDFTSFGGVIFGPNGQTTLLAFISAGAAGSYGTVFEPASDPQKCPNPMVYFYQARGFNLAESYYQSIASPFLGLVAGDALSTPYAQSGKSKWSGVASNVVATGILTLTNTAFSGRPLQRMELFVDGKYFQTVTNIAPTPGNVLTTTIEGYPVSYTVPTNATISTIVTGLVSKINLPWLTNITRVAAFPRGDRVELRSASSNVLADPYYFLDPSVTNTSQVAYRVDYLPFPAQPTFNSLVKDTNGYQMKVETVPGVPCILQASTNLVDWVTIATNWLGGETNIVDPLASSLDHRFYRLFQPLVNPLLQLIATNKTAPNIHVQTFAGISYVLQSSTNLTDWANVASNATGSSMDYVDAGAIGAGARFYRAVATLPSLPPASVSAVSNAASGGELVSIGNASRAYTLKETTNGTQWFAVLTNANLGGGQISASSSVGSADALTTFISAAQGKFVPSQAIGNRSYLFGGSSATSNGSWLQLTVTKTNGSIVVLGVTNQGANTLAGMAMQLLNNVNAEPALQGSDGVTWDDYSVDGQGFPSFTIYARSGGLASGLGSKVKLAVSSPALVSPSGTVTLTGNLSDQQARNHLYVTAGLNTLAGIVQLDTTQFPDGYHDLTAVSYEGSSVATQTKATVPIRIQNTALTASLTLLDLANSSPVQGVYHVQVSANTNTVTQISLFTTGGPFATATNQSSATFNVDGTVLRAGLHPFYALVSTSDGLQYRTETKYARLVNGP